MISLQELVDRWQAATPEQLAAVATQHSPFWVSLVLVIAVGYEAARVLWLAIPAPEPGSWTPPARIARTGPAQETAGNAADIVAAHLFGRFEPGAQPGNARVDAPETNLTLQLLGAVSTADEHFAHAIIADGTGTQKVYFLKDTVPGGATLQSIQEDRVILNRGGTLEALVLPRDSKGSGAPAPPRLDAMTQPAAPSVQEVVTQNANNLLLTVIRPQPYMPNGEMKGYRVYPGRNREQFAALGLLPGDLVTQINGAALSNPNQAMEMFRGLANTTQAQLAVERDGKTQTITLDTSQLATAGGATK